MKMSKNNDYIQLPPLKKDTPSDVVAFMWEYMKVPENSREKVKNLLKDANENGEIGRASCRERVCLYV